MKSKLKLGITLVMVNVLIMFANVVSLVEAKNSTNILKERLATRGKI
jgi:hypothetical protein